MIHSDDQFNDYKVKNVCKFCIFWCNFCIEVSTLWTRLQTLSLPSPTSWSFSTHAPRRPGSLPRSLGDWWVSTVERI